MTVDIFHKIIKTYDHNNKLVKMVDEDITFKSINISHFEYYLFFTVINENIVKSDNSVFHRSKIKLNPYGWFLLIFTLVSLSLLFI